MKGFSILCKYFIAIRKSKGEKLTLEETQVDEIELTEFVPDEAPDRVNIRRDPLFDDVKIKVCIFSFNKICFINNSFFLITYKFSRHFIEDVIN